MMPRVDFTLWDRVYILKLICTAQMTFASFTALLYTYMIVLQVWTSLEDKRKDIMELKYTVLVITIIDFCAGTLLAFAANMSGICCRRRIVIWIIIEIIQIPTSIFIIMRLYHKIISAKQYLITDGHFLRINIVQVTFLTCHFFFIAYAIDFLVHRKPKPKCYDPSIRPESVYAPTNPQITTTESQHVRISQSILFQPSTSKGFQKNLNEDKEEDTSSNQ